MEKNGRDMKKYFGQIGISIKTSGLHILIQKNYNFERIENIK
jgi:hypothetical protein